MGRQSRNQTGFADLLQLGYGVAGAETGQSVSPPLNRAQFHRKILTRINRLCLIEAWASATFVGAMKRLSAAAIAMTFLIQAPVLLADEGMWTFDNPPRKQWKE